VKRARELIYTAEHQAPRDVSLAGLRPKPGSSQTKLVSYVISLFGVLFCLVVRLLFVNNVSRCLSSYNNNHTNIYNV
jgi:hypothetical protein